MTSKNVLQQHRWCFWALWKISTRPPNCSLTLARFFNIHSHLGFLSTRKKMFRIEPKEILIEPHQTERRKRQQQKNRIATWCRWVFWFDEFLFICSFLFVCPKSILWWWKSSGIVCSSFFFSSSPRFFVLVIWMHTAQNDERDWNFDRAHALNTAPLFSFYFSFFLSEVYLTTFRTQYRIFEHIIVCCCCCRFLFYVGGIYRVKKI